MAKLPPPPDPISAAIDAWHESQPEEPRPYLGYSLLGHHCDRYLWLTFRWAVIERFSGRMKRLFRRGHREEETVVEDLRAIGCVVHSTGDDQQPLWIGGHCGSGGCDGIIESGVPGAGKTRHVLEVKTHGAKSFAHFVGTETTAPKTVIDAKPQHYGQMQLAMHALDISRALYVAVCKDDDRQYTERVEYKQDVAEALLERGARITEAELAPEPCAGASPDWWQCKMCPAHDLCHGSRLTREVNCRTCAHSTAVSDGTWRCERWGEELPVERQRLGCEAHVLHPDLVPWELDTQASSMDEAVYIIDGEPVRNGDGDANTFTSREIIERIKETEQ